MKIYRIIFAAIISVLLLPGCSGTENKKSDVETELSNTLKKSGIESYFDTNDSAEEDTLVVIGGDTNYTAETVLESTGFKVLKIRPKKQ